MTTRILSETEWIETHGSGTLRHAFDLDVAYKSLYRHERVAFTFGGAFHAIERTRITLGTVQAEADCRPFTEGCWNIRRRRAEHFPGDTYSGPLWIRVEHADGSVEEGMGLTVEPNGCPWIPKGMIVFAIVSPAKNGNYTGEVLCL